MTPLLAAVMGPTASGKTDLAERMAERLHAQLVNADAFQIYRGMDIGTAKPDDTNRYLLLDLKDPNEGFGVGEYVAVAAQALHALWEQKRNVVVVGGTGLYIRALFEEYSGMLGPPEPSVRRELIEREESEGLEGLVADLKERAPEVAAKIDQRNPARVRRALERALSEPAQVKITLPPFRKIKLGLFPPPELIQPRIADRARDMIERGWLAEVEHLANNGYGPGDPGFRAHGYRAMWRHVRGEVALEDALAGTIVEVQQYAKRQRTWLRAEPGLKVLAEEGDPLELSLSAIGEGLV